MGFIRILKSVFVEVTVEKIFSDQKMSIFCLGDGRDLHLFWRSSCAMLHFNDHVSPTCTNEDLKHCFYWGVSRAQYIGTLSLFNVKFAYRDHGSWPHTVTLSLFQTPMKW